MCGKASRRKGSTLARLRCDDEPIRIGLPRSRRSMTSARKTMTSRGFSRVGTAARKIPTGRLSPRSLIEWTQKSTSCLNKAASSSAEKKFGSRTRDSGISLLRSPRVSTGTMWTRESGRSRRSASAIRRLCATASKEPRVPSLRVVLTLFIAGSTGCGSRSPEACGCDPARTCDRKVGIVVQVRRGVLPAGSARANQLSRPNVGLPAA